MKKDTTNKSLNSRNLAMLSAVRENATGEAVGSPTKLPQGLVREMKQEGGEHERSLKKVASRDGLSSRGIVNESGRVKIKE